MLSQSVHYIKTITNIYFNNNNNNIKYYYVAWQFREKMFQCHENIVKIKQNIKWYKNIFIERNLLDTTVQNVGVSKIFSKEIHYFIQQ